MKDCKDCISYDPEPGEKWGACKEISLKPLDYRVKKDWRAYASKTDAAHDAHLYVKEDFGCKLHKKK